MIGRLIRTHGHTRQLRFNLTRANESRCLSRCGSRSRSPSRQNADTTPPLPSSSWLEPSKPLVNPSWAWLLGSRLSPTRQLKWALLRKAWMTSRRQFW